MAQRAFKGEDVKFKPIKKAAEALGLPAAFLKNLAEEGRVPGLWVGEVFYVEISGARRELADQAGRFIY